VTTKKKLIEVAFPVDAVNEASKPETENPFLKDHPRSIHNWWARTPLNVCRAVLFAQLVDDPSSHPDRFPDSQSQNEERDRLHRIIKELAQWENTTNEDVLRRAREEITKSIGSSHIVVMDPFCGRGSIPLEAQRLGLETHASDLNPVAVLITKALIEIPPKFAGKPPVHPEQARELTKRTWKRAEGLAEDVRHYGEWMRSQAEERIGHLYPKVRVTPEMAEERDDLESYVGEELTVIAWLWARTVTCPNPACGAEMPLIRSFWLSKKKGKQAWIEPVVDQEGRRVEFAIRTGEGEPPEASKIGRGAKFRCLVCDQTSEEQHIKQEGMAGRMGARLIAIVAEGDRGRVYVPPVPDHENAAANARPTWRPDQKLAYDPRNIWCRDYGLETFGDLFTDRQLVALTTFSDLVGEARERVMKDALAAGRADDGIPLSEGGIGARAYADTVSVLLGFSVSRLADYSNALCTWNPTNGNISHLFQRQAIPMAWDFAEANAVDSLSVALSSSWVAGALTHIPCSGLAVSVEQADARTVSSFSAGNVVVCTDPPYYDNIGYADLSDFFYVWLRRCLREVYPDLLSTILTPKDTELVATPYRRNRGSTADARETFRDGFVRVFGQLQEISAPDFPMVVYYAFKQEETGEEGTASTGWETMLDGLISAGYQVTATIPGRTTKKARAIARGTNALASTMIIACRPMGDTTQRITRREFISLLKQELPVDVNELRRCSFPPVDLAQASIGPGMAVFSRFRSVLEEDGSAMTVRTALALTNQVLDEILTTEEGDYDSDTRWALTWFQQEGFSERDYGEADKLAVAKNVSIRALKDRGILQSGSGKVRLLPTAELATRWDPSSDERLTIWEITNHLVRALNSDGESAAADIARAVGPRAAAARDLAYRLYQICERKGWVQEALGYNALAVAWPEIERRASRPVEAKPEQQSLGLG